MQVTIDKRLEIIEAIIVAYKQIDKINDEELDFVEYPNIPYVKELIQKINIKNYPEINKFIKDNLDCGKYTNLYLYFDKDMNFTDNNEKQVFNVGSTKEFANIVKKIYENENLEEIFIQYKDYFENIKTYFNHLPNINLDEMKEFYNASNNLKYHKVVSALINGGFSCKKGNEVSYVKGIKANNPYLNYPYYIMCMFHEYSHYFVNPLVDKYRDKFENIELLQKESLEHGLPPTYQTGALLYEYFVRTNTLVLSEPFVPKEEIDIDLHWYKDIGFSRVSDLYKIVKQTKSKYNNYEEIFVNELIPYVNSVTMEVIHKK